MPSRTASDLKDAALLLCAHGRGGEDADDGVPQALAAALRRRGDFARVEACFLRGEPGFSDVLAGIDAERIFLAPLLMADGHTNQVLLPAMLASAGLAARRVTLCHPVGLSPALAPLAADAATALCAERGWAADATTVVIAGHGTEKHAKSGASGVLLAERITALGRFGAVSAAFLEQAPFVEAVLRGLRPAPCVVVGFFIDHGGHSADEIPRLIAAAHPEAAYTGAIAAAPGFAEIVLDTVRQATVAR